MVQPIPQTKVKVGGQVLSEESVDVTYDVRMSDAGKYLQFSCDWHQTGPDGEILFYGQEESSFLDRIEHSYNKLMQCQCLQNLILYAIWLWYCIR